MSTPPIKVFHAHVYYDDATKEKAARLYGAIEDAFDAAKCDPANHNSLGPGGKFPGLR